MKEYVKALPWWMAVMAVFAFAGCAGEPTSHLSNDFGQSYKTAFNAQVLHPDAPRDTSAADTLPGEIADKIYQNRYVHGLTSKPKDKDDESVSDRIK